MDLLTDAEAGLRQSDIVFRQSKLPLAGMIGGGIFALGVALPWITHEHSLMMTLWRVVLLLTGSIWLAATIGMFRAANRDSNWLLRIRNDKVLIHLRSYLNWRFDAGEITVARLDRSEIRLVRGSSATRETQSPGRGSGSRILRVERLGYLDLVLSEANLDALESVLRRERQHPAVGGSFMRSRSQHAPVQIADGNTIRLTWRGKSDAIIPRIDVALKQLGLLTKTGQATIADEDYSLDAMRRLSSADQQDRLIILARVDQLAAVDLIRRLYHCSVTESHDRVQALLSL